MGYLCSRCGGVGGVFESSHLHSDMESCLSELKAEKHKLKLQNSTLVDNARVILAENKRLERLNDSLKNFIEDYGGCAHLILTTTFDDDAHKWVKTLEDIVDKSIDPELLYWCAWCGVHRVEVENWADMPQCPAIVAARKLKEQWTPKLVCTGHHWQPDPKRGPGSYCRNCNEVWLPT